MTYWCNVWRNSQPSRVGADAAVQYWATEEQAVEEIVCGAIGFYYDETLRVECKFSTVIDLKPQARKYEREAHQEQQADLAMTPSWEPL